MDREKSFADAENAAVHKSEFKRNVNQFIQASVNKPFSAKYMD